jgi:hypothetical protein
MVAVQPLPPPERGARSAGSHTLRRVESTRLLVARVRVDGDLVALGYADVFVVVREGESGPGPNDWEVTVRTPAAHRLVPGAHVLELEPYDGSPLSGRALLRYSDGRQHLFRGDGDLVGYDAG